MKWTFLTSLISCLLFESILLGQGCPIPPSNNFRNNGTGGTCLAGVTIPSGKQHTGRFTFQNNTGFTTNQYLDKVLLNGQLYQQGQVLYIQASTIWFGGYNASSKDLCFYGNSNNDNAVPAGKWTLFFRDVNTQALTTCINTIDASGNSSTFSSGAISGDQTICSGGNPVTLTSSSAASSCSGVTYQWRQSTTSSMDGYVDITNATSTTYTPPSGSLTQTTYFIRVATCSSSSVSSSTDPVTVSVVSLSGTQTIPKGSTTTFSSSISGGTWTSDNTSIATVNGTSGVVTAVNTGTTIIKYTVNGTTCSRSFTVTNPLPVTWLSFTGKPAGKQVVLDWSTATEINSLDFRVMHSTDGSGWKEIGSVTAAGNSTSTHNYRFIHTSPADGQNTYQLLQRDIDGRSEYSRVVKVMIGKGESGLFVYPNPVEDHQIRVQLKTGATIILYNTIGAEVYRQPVPMGTNTLTLPNLPAGVYRLRAGKETVPLIIQ